MEWDSYSSKDIHGGRVFLPPDCLHSHQDSLAHPLRFSPSVFFISSGRGSYIFLPLAGLYNLDKVIVYCIPDSSTLSSGNHLMETEVGPFDKMPEPRRIPTLQSTWLSMMDSDGPPFLDIRHGTAKVNLLIGRLTPHADHKRTEVDESKRSAFLLMPVISCTVLGPL